MTKRKKNCGVSIAECTEIMQYMSPDYHIEFECGGEEVIFVYKLSADDTTDDEFVGEWDLSLMPIFKELERQRDAQIRYLLDRVHEAITMSLAPYKTKAAKWDALKTLLTA